jgi:hypothetical protein
VVVRDLIMVIFEDLDHICLAQVHVGRRWSNLQDMIEIIFMLYLVKCKL